ncbi:hypothetical protein Cob_v002321 [Colletotrichum orbiculare MAFF 240422]|uniref:Uncharacterized protein n=1 Tax=Colletotrichum orbiculare (strain 104-T / ATCC 96160 / CBS 514.97 / LARS 414 / MAFF 240422) TaxID=1213857 RepID=A0A484G335_COLOR|nr:hypothetical protein Cob_v002321 [Colletotrichum orbiculare MAFF 240422]
MARLVWTAAHLVLTGQDPKPCPLPAAALRRILGEWESWGAVYSVPSFARLTAQSPFCYSNCWYPCHRWCQLHPAEYLLASCGLHGGYVTG